MKLKNLITIVTAVILFSACSKNDDGPEIDLHKYELSIDDIAVVGQEVGLLMETTEDYSCSNFTIELDLKQTEDDVTLIVGDVVEPIECLTAEGPATGREKIVDIDSDTPITIQADGQTVEGKLTVTEEEFILTLQENDLIRLGHNQVAR